MKLANTLKSLAVVVAALGLVAPAANAADAAYPSRTITMICTHGAGGDTDFNTRLISRLLEKELGVSVVVSNVPGANASVAYNKYKDDKPDGYTLIGTNTMSLASDEASGLTDFGYTAFEPVAIYGKQCGENMIISTNSPYKSLDELVKASQAKPETIKMGIAMGGSSYVAALIMEQDLKTKFAIVDAGGDGAGRVTSLLGGHIDMTIAPYTLAKEYIESGKVRPLFTMMSSRLPAAPDIPTAVDCGIKNLKMDSLYAVFAPKGTPKEIVAKLNAAIVKIVTTNPEYKAAIAKFNYQEPYVLDVEGTIARLKEQREHIMQYSSYLQ